MEFIFCKMVVLVRFSFCWASFLESAWKDKYNLIFGSVPEGRRQYQEPSENIIFKALEEGKSSRVFFLDFKL